VHLIFSLSNATNRLFLDQRTLEAAVEVTRRGDKEQEVAGRARHLSTRAAWSELIGEECAGLSQLLTTTWDGHESCRLEDQSFDDARCLALGTAFFHIAKRGTLNQMCAASSERVENRQNQKLSRAGKKKLRRDHNAFIASWMLPRAPVKTPKKKQKRYYGGRSAPRHRRVASRD